MNNYPQQAEKLRLARICALIADQDIIDWAYQIIEKEDNPDYSFIELTETKNQTKELLSKLKKLCEGCDHFEALRDTIALMYHKALVDKDSIEFFTRFLENESIENDYTVPEDLSFIIGADDERCLADDNIMETREEFNSRFIQELKQIKDKRTNGST